ncbi:uncharacterized protein LOC116953924 isoform X3 [Petromyzon marinus]|uniref:uncharacterized protein LOC116953924 isoform X3 n=1 Tax=Petromyzon marinus TaxID=7757 RepID=UPI003F72BAC7
MDKFAIRMAGPGGLFPSIDPGALENMLAMKPPQLEVYEQPKSRGMRFRYECEGRCAGSILGDRSTDSNKTYPAVKLVNCTGPAKVRVSLVSKNDPHRPHPHSLVGKDCSDGVCEVDVSSGVTIVQFQNLGIQCVKKKEVADALKLRLQKNVNPYKVSEEQALGTEEIDMNVVRLCFEAFIHERGRVIALPPIVSQEIRDKKAPNVSELKICRVNLNAGSARGGDEVFLLCDKVQKEDIEVRFFEPDGSWESRGSFSQADVHRQVAIVFRTPAYRDPGITRPASVRMQLRRPSDGEASEPIEFRYIPVDPDPHKLQEKRKRKADSFDKFLESTNITGLGTPSGNIAERKVAVSTTSSQKSKELLRQKIQDKTQEASFMRGAGFVSSPRTPPASAGYDAQPSLSGVTVAPSVHPAMPSSSLSLLLPAATSKAPSPGHTARQSSVAVSASPSVGSVLVLGTGGGHYSQSALAADMQGLNVTELNPVRPPAAAAAAAAAAQSRAAENHSPLTSFDMPAATGGGIDSLTAMSFSEFEFLGNDMYPFVPNEDLVIFATPASPTLPAQHVTLTSAAATAAAAATTAAGTPDPDQTTSVSQLSQQQISDVLNIIQHSMRHQQDGATAPETAAATGAAQANFATNSPDGREVPAWSGGAVNAQSQIHSHSPAPDQSLQAPGAAYLAGQTGSGLGPGYLSFPDDMRMESLERLDSAELNRLLETVTMDMTNNVGSADGFL